MKEGELDNDAATGGKINLIWVGLSIFVWINVLTGSYLMQQTAGILVLLTGGNFNQVFWVGELAYLSFFTLFLILALERLKAKFFLADREALSLLKIQIVLFILLQLFEFVLGSFSSTLILSITSGVHGFYKLYETRMIEAIFEVVFTTAKYLILILVIFLKIKK